MFKYTPKNKNHSIATNQEEQEEKTEGEKQRESKAFDDKTERDSF